MIHVPLYFLDGIPFARGYERVVHGGRGAYVELTKEDIITELRSRFGNELPSQIFGDEPYYYYYLVPVGRNEKVYWQIKTVKYADYKQGLYYIAPDLLLPFEERDPRVNPLF